MWPSRSGLQQNERQHWHLPCLGVNRQLEAIRKQRPHHQAHLVFTGITFGARECQTGLS